MSKKTINVEMSTKNTKEQILLAYQDALLKLEEKQNHQEITSQTQRIEKQETVKKALGSNNESIVTDLGNLKINILKSIEIISENLMKEFGNLTTLRKAIEIEQKHLEEVYGIKENLHTFTALIIAQQEKKERFELDMSEKQITLQSNLTALKEEYEEELARIKKNRQREDDDYKYHLNIQRRKEHDDYNFRKAELEKELTQKSFEIENRENIILSNEAKFKELEGRVAHFSNEMDDAIKAAEDKLRYSLELEHRHNTELKAKEYEMAVKLGEQQITSLQQKVKEQEALIKELTNKVNIAGDQVQSIACKALDTSAQRYVSNYSEPKGNDKTSSI